MTAIGGAHTSTAVTRAVGRIVAVNLHAVIDELYVVEDFEVNGTFRCAPAQRFPAGKGVNVAFALAGLGYQPDLVLVAGEDTVPLYESSLSERGIELHAVSVPLPTRRHITISDPGRQTTTHLQAGGVEHPREAFDRAREIIETLLGPGDTLILSGSLPAGAPSDLYGQLIEAAKRRGASSLLDTSGDNLRLGVEAQPEAIKPNRAEAEYLCGRPLPDLHSQLASARELQSCGIDKVMLSDGASGVLLVGGHDAWHGVLPADEIVAVNTQGCGDSVVAGFVDASHRGMEPPEALRWSVACGAANALVDGAGWIRLEDVQRLSERVRIESL